MKVKTVKRYYDVKLKKIMEVGESLEVDEARGKHLVSEGMAVEETEAAAGDEPAEEG